MMTIHCTDPSCGYCTDIETTSDTNPRHCPECGEPLVTDQDEPYPEEE